MRAEIRLLRAARRGAEDVVPVGGAHAEARVVVLEVVAHVELAQLLPDARPRDVVLGLPSYFSLGFLRPGPGSALGSSPRAFGAPGAGGSLGFADPDARLGYAYVMNKLDFYLLDDPREKALRDAVYRAIGAS